MASAQVRLCYSKDLGNYASHMLCAVSSLLRKLLYSEHTGKVNLEGFYFLDFSENCVQFYK